MYVGGLRNKSISAPTSRLPYNSCLPSVKSAGCDLEAVRYTTFWQKRFLNDAAPLHKLVGMSTPASIKVLYKKIVFEFRGS